MSGLRFSGDRRRSFDEVNARVATIAGGLQALGVKPGDCVCVLMRNDIAFIEAAYAAMRLGAYGVPVNWHFKPEEINYVLKDSGTSVTDIAFKVGFNDPSYFSRKFKDVFGYPPSQVKP